jgi:hypothetical protein
VYICALGSLVSLVFYVINKNAFQLQRKNVAINILLIFCFIIYSKGFSVFGVIEQLFIYSNIVVALNLKDEFKIKVFDFLTKGMGILLGVSLFFYVSHLLGLPLPSSTIGVSTLGYTGINYYFFLTNLELIDFYRFRSIFAEPGHLTMGLMLLLFANKFNMRNKWVVVLMLAQLFTLSLAGVVAIGFSLLVYSFSRQINTLVPRLIIGAVIVFSFFFVGSLGEDDLLYLAIVSRLTVNENTGRLHGNNRTDADTDAFYEKYSETSDFFFGLGNETTSAIVSEGGAGYKIFLIRFGLISAVFVLAFYLAFALNYRQYEVFCFFLLLMLLLSQNAYPFWFCVVFTFILGIPKLYYKPEIKA